MLTHQLMLIIPQLMDDFVLFHCHGTPNDIVEVDSETTQNRPSKLESIVYDNISTFYNDQS
jgi:hypothetical protein